MLKVQASRREASKALYSDRKGKKVSFQLKLLPYYAWANRGVTEMDVGFPGEINLVFDGDPDLDGGTFARSGDHMDFIIFPVDQGEAAMNVGDAHMTVHADGMDVLF